MPDGARLEALLRRIDGRGYPAYRDLEGVWQLGEVELVVDRVQGDPFAAPSRVRVRVATGIADAVRQDPVSRCAAEDWLLRRFGASLRGRRRGSGRSGEIGTLTPGQEIVPRSGVRLQVDGRAEVRLTAGLPARGRRIDGRQAWLLLTEDLVDAAMQLRDVAGEAGLARHLASVRCQAALRAQLRARGLVAFIADGSVLPRRSGVDRRPLEGALPFESPASLRVSLDGPDGPVTGMGVPSGVTLVVGGGFHGKSTVLQAIQSGVLDHVPGDGRERVVADPAAVKVRAEDGRRVAGVDVSAFLGDLPGGTSTRPLWTDDASGSTSQAAAIIEAVEAGARVLLLDEDTSATNLMVRDERMAALIPADREPITPLVQRLQQLHAERGVSTVLVVGGVGDYLAVADRVVLMDSWRAEDATARAKALSGRPPAPPGPLPAALARIPDGDSLRPTGKGRVRARDHRRVELGREEIDLAGIEQVRDGPHAASLGHALRLLSEGLADGRRRVPAVLDALDAVLDAEGPDALSPFETPLGTLVRPRRHEVAAAMNRLRTLRVRTESP